MKKKYNAPQTEYLTTEPAKLIAESIRQYEEEAENEMESRKWLFYYEDWDEEEEDE